MPKCLHGGFCASSRNTANTAPKFVRPEGGWPRGGLGDRKHLLTLPICHWPIAITPGCGVTPCGDPALARGWSLAAGGIIPAMAITLKSAEDLAAFSIVDLRADDDSEIEADVA